MAFSNQIPTVRVGGGIYDVTADKRHPLGARLELSDGRVFRYVEAGGAIGKGTGCLSEAPAANHEDLDVAAAAVGATTVTVTLGATAAAENLYAEGYLLVVDGTGEGDMYRITGHAAISSAGTGDIKIADGLVTALAASSASQVTLLKNLYKDLAVWGATPATKCIGVPLVDFADTEFGWVLTSGVGPADASTTGPVEGDPLIAGASGSFTVASAATDQILATCIAEGPDSGEFCFAYMEME